MNSPVRSLWEGATLPLPRRRDGSRESQTWSKHLSIILSRLILASSLQLFKLGIAFLNKPIPP